MNFKDQGFYIYELHYLVYQNWYFRTNPFPWSGLPWEHNWRLVTGALFSRRTFLFPLHVIYVFLGVGTYFSENIRSLLAFLLTEITLFRYCVLGTWWQGWGPYLLLHTFKVSTSKRCTARGSWVTYKSLISVAEICMGRHACLFEVLGWLTLNRYPLSKSIHRFPSILVSARCTRRKLQCCCGLSP